jgi:hypothetical protein
MLTLPNHYIFTNNGDIQGGGGYEQWDSAD